MTTEAVIGETGTMTVIGTGTVTVTVTVTATATAIATAEEDVTGMRGVRRRTASHRVGCCAMITTTTAVIDAIATATVTVIATAIATVTATATTKTVTTAHHGANGGTCGTTQAVLVTVRWLLRRHSRLL